LILGAFSNLTAVVGSLLSVAIWSTAEGFGGPYKTGSTDIGAAIIYLLVFTGLFLSFAGLHYGVDRWLTPNLGRLGFLAAGGFARATVI
jgi:thiosulfate dehydrogenase (quinone) large subunit